MKDDIRNIINLEKIGTIGSSLSLNTQLPSKDSIVKLIPLEYLEHGLKVLIDGKLYIAFIEGKIPLKEEIIAVVTNTNPFSLSLSLIKFLKDDEDHLINQVLKKFQLPKRKSLKNIIPQVVIEDKNLIKSKILELEELMNNLKVEGLEFSLLVDLIWSSSNVSKAMISDLYENLFNEPFEEVCSNLFESIKLLQFSELPQFIVQKINNELIYDPDTNNSGSLLNKIEPISELIKHFSNDTQYRGSIEKDINGFIQYGTKYILQKSVLKDYDFLPDFIAVKRESEIILVLYSIKKVVSVKNQTVYKIYFKNDNLPFQLKGIIRNNFLEGQLDISDQLKEEESKNTLEKNLFSHWGFRSEIKTDKRKTDEYYVSKINTAVNKLIS
jgi:hypothetical protein